jgi:protein transport protein SEC31
MQVNDAEKRLGIFFDHLNNEEIKPDVAAQMHELAQALRVRDYDSAQGIHTALMTSRAGEGSQWMTGIKRLIAMSKATPE